MTSRTLVSEFEEEFRKIKATCETAIAQVRDDELHAQINAHQNSVAVVMQHVGGNLVSRFTDFISADGEKPGRNRDGEFEDRKLSRDELKAIWERGWAAVFDAITPLTDADLTTIVTIRKEPHTVHKALLRACTHLTWHASQFALMGKHFRGDAWNYMTIPPKKSTEFNRAKGV